MSNEQQEDQPGPPQEEEQAAGLYPGPPPYWEFFTAASVQQFKGLREQADVTEDPKPASDLAKAVTIPEDNTGLQYLIPPPEPIDGKAATFASFRWKNPSVLPFEPFRDEALHSTPPKPEELKQLSRANLLCTLEYFNIMAVNPDKISLAQKWDDIWRIQGNFLEALNMYRSWAAREELIRVMEAQVQRAKDEIAEIDRLEQKTDELMDSFRKDAAAVDSPANSDAMELDGAPAHAQNGANGTSGQSTGHKAARGRAALDIILASTVDE